MEMLNLLRVGIGILVSVPICLLIIRCCIGILIRFIPGYGRLVELMACTFDEDFVNFNPKCNIVSSLELDGDVTIYKIRKLFHEQVLNAKLPGSYNQLRYPEFRQYITTIFGFLVWKDTENFEISEYIIEEKEEIAVLDMGKLHQTLMNKRFRGNMSPWEIILYRNVIPVDEKDLKVVETSKPKSVLAFRVHHSMCDAKSIIKLFVECLGQKPLNTAKSHDLPMCLRDRLLFPLNILQEYVGLLLLTWKYCTHPWRLNRSDNGQLLVQFSKPLSIKHLKCVANENGVTLSSVILSLIGETMRNFDKALVESGTALGYVIPKENHPDILANHYNLVVDFLPKTTECGTISRCERLKRYDSIFKRMKNPVRHPFYEYSMKLTALIPSGRAKRFFNSFKHRTFGSVGITNIAGDRDGFYIGNAWCSGFRMTASLPKTSIGVIFCILSYQNDLRIAIVGYDCVISKMDASKVVNLIGLEYDKLELQKS